MASSGKFGVNAVGDLFAERDDREELADGAVVLRGFALAAAATLIESIHEIAARAPFRHLITPGGYRMSVAMTNCGEFGWISDEHGYRYGRTDPLTDVAWPSMPDSFEKLASNAAQAAGFTDFVTNACIVNRYEPGARLTLHQDRDERDFKTPIVSVSLGLPAVFLFGGLSRRDRCRRVLLHHGDVVVWGGASRLAYHGVNKLDAGVHPLTGECRLNLTFRRY